MKIESTKVISLRLPMSTYENILIECEAKGITITEWYERQIAAKKAKVKSKLVENPKKSKAERISIYAIIAFFMMFLFWCWSYSEKKNEIKNLKKVHELYIDSVNIVMGELQIQLDTIHNNSSKIPDENFKN